MKRTLLLDSNSQTGLCQSLLLTLAGHRVAETRTAADALNRVLEAKDGPEPFGLLVVSRYPSGMPFGEFLRILREGAPDLRILVFRRPENPLPSPFPGVCWCLPDDAVEAASVGAPLPPAPPLDAFVAGDLRSSW